MKFILKVFIGFFFVIGYNQVNAQGQMSPTPTALLELFSSEGCESCPYADVFMEEILRLADSTNSPVYVIDYHVDIWNRQGWYDSLSTPEFSLRQRTYMKKVKQDAMFTPMVYINGQYGMPGGYKKEIGQAIYKEMVTPAKVGLTINANLLNNGKGLSVSYNLTNKIDSAQVTLVLVENEVVNNITGGENKGKTLHHHHVARQMYTIPVKNEYSGIYQFPIDPEMDLSKYTLVGFVQHINSWQVLSTDQVFFKKRMGY
jgi:hypothetical protein